MSHGPVPAACAGAANETAARVEPATSTALSSAVRARRHLPRGVERMFTTPPQDSSERPLLVVLPVAGPQLNLGAVGRAGAGNVEAQSGLDTRDSAVAIDIPLLVGLAVAAPDDDRGAVGGPP